MREIDTPFGPARIEVAEPGAPAWGALALGHGAGGGVDAPDLVVARNAALAAGLVVARITQPYRVAGRRAPAPAPQLDAAWIVALGWFTGTDGPLAGLRSAAGDRLPLAVGGRSSGARVVCRTAAAVGARGIVALAFPVHPPGRPERSRLPELDTGLPTLVVSGERDPFGIPPAAPDRAVVLVPATGHDLRRGAAVVDRAVTDWLSRWQATVT